MSTAIGREESLFDEARELTDPARRRAFLDRACKGDMMLRKKIEKLLVACERADEFFAECTPALRARALTLPGETPPTTTGTNRVQIAHEEKPSTRIGPYKLLQKIGEGGCGVVYMAEQEKAVRRRVALKIIKLGMDTKSVIARFEAERQALAMMDHPNIARVLDAGATETGRPYFVMELVYGVKITDYCDQNQLGT